MANEKRLIDANALKDLIYRRSGNLRNDWSSSAVLLAVDSQPTVDAVEVVHGRWEKHGKHDWRCSACKMGVPYSYTGHKYCHNCGADMRERRAADDN